MTTPVSNRCSVCKHPDIDNINSRIIAGVSSRDLGNEFDLGYKSIQNHAKRHLPKQMVKAAELQDQQSADKLLTQVNGLYDKALLLIEKADSDQKWGAAASLIKEARNSLELTAKLIGTLKTGHTVNITYNQEFVQARVAIYEALKPFPEAREAVIYALEEGGIIDADHEAIDNS